MTIRSAEPEDAEAVSAISNAVIRETLVTFTTKCRDPADIAADITARGDAFLVAERHDVVVGFATYGPFRSGPGYVHTREHSIQLAPEAQGQGLGRQLISALEHTAVRSGVHVLVAGISAVNPAAIRLHTAQGFTEVGRMPQVGHKWGQWLDLVLMQKTV